MAPEPALRAIVGIGASAGGLDAFSQLLHGLPVDTGMALVLVLTSRPAAREHPAGLAVSRTKMPVVQVTDEAAAKPNHVYVIPPNTNMAISGSVLHLSPREASPERHMPDRHILPLARGGPEEQ